MIDVSGNRRAHLVAPKSNRNLVLSRILFCLRAFPITDVNEVVIIISNQSRGESKTRRRC